MQRHDYYVYVYIDPRNHEQFYYGQGQGARKDAHLNDKSDNEKVKRIAEIRGEGLDPIIRVIAKGLSKEEALLIEKTLLWKLGKWTTNVATGHFAKKFRPRDTLHKEIFGFDFQNNFFYYNVGEHKNLARNWDDYRRYGFISAGWGAKTRETMLSFNIGDLVAAYLKNFGFVGVGRIKETAKMIRDVRVNGTPLLDLPLNATNAGHDCDDEDDSEHVCLVTWIRRVPREKAKWKPKAGLFTTPQIKASLRGQPKTVKFLEREFDINITKTLK